MSAQSAKNAPNSSPLFYVICSFSYARDTSSFGPRRNSFSLSFLEVLDIFFFPIRDSSCRPTGHPSPTIQFPGTPLSSFFSYLFHRSTFVRFSPGFSLKLPIPNCALLCPFYLTLHIYPFAPSPFNVFLFRTSFSPRRRIIPFSCLSRSATLLNSLPLPPRQPITRQPLSFGINPPPPLPRDSFWVHLWAHFQILAQCSNFLSAPFQLAFLLRRHRHVPPPSETVAAAPSPTSSVLYLSFCFSSVSIASPLKVPPFLFLAL